jgi:N6-adenosine-specific RNA methylase IME4
MIENANSRRSGRAAFQGEIVSEARAPREVNRTVTPKRRLNAELHSRERLTAGEIYGANGFTGHLVAVEAKRQGLCPVLAGRRAGPIEALAEDLGLPARVFDIGQPQAAAAALSDMAVVSNCAGPFSATSAQMIDACLASRTHYVDITGELEVFLILQAREIFAAWGFEFRTGSVWVKTEGEGKHDIGEGHYFRQEHEHLLLGIRGDVPAPPTDRRPPSVFYAPRREHSRKPDEAYEIIERMYPELPKIELFARHKRDGWERWGKEAPAEDAAAELPRAANDLGAAAADDTAPPVELESASGGVFIQGDPEQPRFAVAA